MPLLVKKLTATAIMPSCANPGEDLGYDLFSDVDIDLAPNKVTAVSTGISARYTATVSWSEFDVREPENWLERVFGVSLIEENFLHIKHTEEVDFNHGLLFRDRSSMAAKGITVSAGVIDSGYTGELKVLLTNNNKTKYSIKAGDKIAQMIPTVVLTGDEVLEVSELPESSRKDGGFGSSGK